jgi:hypothetical protein
VAVGSGRNGQSLVLVCAALALAVIGIGLAVARKLENAAAPEQSSLFTEMPA